MRRKRHFITGRCRPPDTLAEYERLQPGIAQRIFELAERQTIYRQAPDEKGQLADIAARNAEIELARRHLRGSQINARLGYLLGWTIGAGCVLKDYQLRGHGSGRGRHRGICMGADWQQHSCNPTFRRRATERRRMLGTARAGLSALSCYNPPPVSHSGRRIMAITLASQAKDVGSIPIARSTLTTQAASGTRSKR